MDYLSWNNGRFSTHSESRNLYHLPCRQSCNPTEVWKKCRICELFNENHLVIPQKSRKTVKFVNEQACGALFVYALWFSAISVGLRDYWWGKRWRSRDSKWVLFEIRTFVILGTRGHHYSDDFFSGIHIFWNFWLICCYFTTPLIRVSSLTLIFHLFSDPPFSNVFFHRYDFIVRGDLGRRSGA